MTKLMTTPTLIRLNARADRLRLNRCLSPLGVANLDPEGIHVVHTAFPHDDQMDVMRLGVFVKMVDTDEPADLFIDVETKEYNALQTWEQMAARLGVNPTLELSPEEMEAALVRHAAAP